MRADCAELRAGCSEVGCQRSQSRGAWYQTKNLIYLIYIILIYSHDDIFIYIFQEEARAEVRGPRQISTTSEEIKPLTSEIQTKPF